MTETIKPLFPNAVTMMALAFGVSSINMALWGNWQMAVMFIFFAGFFDFMDGKVARILGVSSRFGAELDSLSDFVSFGVAPGFLMYNWTMNSAMRAEALRDIAYRPDAVGVYWAVVLFLAVCCASRLARFNSMLDEKQPKYWEHFFMGVPAPAGAGLALYPLILWLAFRGEIDFFRCPLFAGFFVIFAGVMMASRVPTICLKHLHLNKTVRSIVGFVFLAFIAGLVASPWMTLSLLGVTYILSIPVSIYVFLMFKRQAR
ncbi:MAG: CDP-alcohol phosphatidyltransferase family protein [Alphaproteobacteria bacterium]|nr:CDP-alcohol phosphatidyltransferase family protein [Alphaproteobacteria bacterium]